MAKGQGISMQTLVVLVLAVIVLLALALLFTGQARGLFDAIRTMGTTSQSGATSAADSAQSVIDSYGGS